MSKMIRFTLIGLGILVLAGGLVFAGAMIGRWTGFGFGWLQPGYRMMVNRQLPGNIVSGYGHGMMRGENGTGPGMMGGGPGYGNVPGMGMMRGYGTTSDNVTPLTIDQAYQAAGKTLAALNNPDLKIAEVMVFDNNAYVRVVEKSTGIGVFELLVEPVSQVVYPEPGPNMMWNLKYGGMIGQQMMGGGKGNFPGMGMMGNYAGNATPADVSAKMPITSAQALQIAQKYLDTALPGTKTATDADPFYGYYTIDFLRDGKTVGMLSVNGFSGQVFLHTWHGTFLEAKDY